MNAAGKIIGTILMGIYDVHLAGKALSISSDHTHLSHGSFSLLPSQNEISEPPGLHFKNQGMLHSPGCQEAELPPPLPEPSVLRRHEHWTLNSDEPPNSGRLVHHHLLTKESLSHIDYCYCCIFSYVCVIMGIVMYASIIHPSIDPLSVPASESEVSAGDYPSSPWEKGKVHLGHVVG